VRHVIYGAGAIGGTIGGRLFEAGVDVVLIARGAHYEALREGGLVLADPVRTRSLPVPVVDHPSGIEWRDDDVAMLCMKTQHTTDALDALAAAAPATIGVVCAQNGVENERLALRRFARVYGMGVMLPATHLKPGQIEAHSAAVPGILDLGCWPAGVDDGAVAVAADLRAGGFASEARPDIMRWKYAKLLRNLGNALDASCGPKARSSTLMERARDEALACFDKAGIDYASAEEDEARRGDLIQMRPIDGRRWGGSSSWQSLARGTGSIETDYLNGEIVLLGRLHGVPTPVNAALQRVAADMARRGAEPGTYPLESLEAEVS